MSTLLPNRLASLQISDFEKRTQFGKNGKKLKVMTNFFEITHLPDICIYQYVPSLSSLLLLFDQMADLLRFDVNITPDVPPILNRYVPSLLHFTNIASLSFVSFRTTAARLPASHV